MATPFDFDAPADDEGENPFGHQPVTDNQHSYLLSLLLRKGVLICALTGETYDEAVFTRAATTLISTHDKWTASAFIDKLKNHDLPGLEEQVNERKMAGAAIRLATDLDDGFYELPDGTVCKVQHAVNGSGNQYAKRLNTETGSFDYQQGLVTRVRKEGVRLTVERAQELGHLYGMCMRCGRTLTDENSIAAGIGPVCKEMAW